ncbi:MAG: hypothetical protein ACOZCL_10475 [Bacillota bacterium]
MSKQRIAAFIILGVLSMSLGFTYLFGLYGPTESEVRTWGLIEAAIGLIIVLLGFTIGSKYFRSLLAVILSVNVLLQILPTILWFSFHGYGISDGTPPSDFVARWYYSLPHIITGLLSIMGVLSLLKPSGKNNI